MRTPLTRLIRNGTVVTALGLLVLFGATFAVSLLARSAHHHETEARNTLHLLDDVRLQLRTLQSSTRGFIVAANPTLRAPGARAARTLDSDIGTLVRRLEQRYPRPTRKMRRAVANWRALNDALLRHLREGRRAAAVRQVATGRGERAIQRAEHAIAELQASESRRVDDESRRVSTLLLLLALAVAIAAPLAAWLGRMLSRRLERDVAQPLRAIGTAARKLGEGDLRARAPSAGVQEVAALGVTFNGMAARMEQLVDELRRLDQMRTQLISSVSHELRTPLTSIRGYTELLSEEEAGPINDEQRENLAVIQRNAERLQALIADLLTLARADAGRLQLHTDEVDLAAVATATVAELEPIAMTARVRLELERGAEVSAEADSSRLHQALTNLITNAVKFSRPGAPVHVRLGTRDGEAFVEVEDHGPGIPASELPRLGERFFRASTAATVDGTGLGLSITKAIAEAHGGRLEVESVEGQGSTFRVVLPLVRGSLPHRA